MDEKLKKFLDKNTGMDAEQNSEIMQDLEVKQYLKGEILLNQGEISRNCYTVLSGCVRQYKTLEDGREITVAFFTEEQAIVLFNSYKFQIPSEYSLACVEDVILLEGNLESEEKLYSKYPELQLVTRNIMETNFGKEQEDRAIFMSLTPEERYINLTINRPDLLKRVPQHQLASYLGIKPESLSRIKKRLSTASN
ncbi:Crp/Fnr family transcriptional regulator [Fusibacter bizertensis]|uniref:Crp/Fnr family transcriptional regulator n=1 Tax=Fusibacter bizertensis TaxID=1488331 RepID=A0ABT6NH67_9FIRM|nr:Crp/Fnr family transcriptional regulator [Fusibacter bizertensis]MDH8679777.1 Crp/Fnr family transcriptional regulator [Fusibacter bizertensis]